MADDVIDGKESGREVEVGIVDDGMLLLVARLSPVKLPAGMLGGVAGTLFGSSSTWSLLKLDVSSLLPAWVPPSV
jgi:hypothetical protein